MKKKTKRPSIEHLPDQSHTAGLRESTAGDGREAWYPEQWQLDLVPGDLVLLRGVKIVATVTRAPWKQQFWLILLEGMPGGHRLEEVGSKVKAHTALAEQHLVGKTNGAPQDKG